MRFIGRIIKQLREEQNLSIEVLAQRSGIELAKFTEIENGNVIPSIGVMIKISRALGQRLGTLLDGGENLGAVITRAADNKPKGEVLSGGAMGYNSHMDFYSLAQGKHDRSMEPMIVRLSEKKEDALSEHEGEEFIYVLSGVVEIKYGKQCHTLTKGDSIYYDSIVPHQVYSGSHEEAEILAVIYTPY